MEKEESIRIDHENDSFHSYLAVSFSLYSDNSNIVVYPLPLFLLLSSFDTAQTIFLQDYIPPVLHFLLIDLFV